MSPTKSHGRGLRLIAAFKLLKGLALLALSIGALKLLHKDVEAIVVHWINIFQVIPTVTTCICFLRSCRFWTTGG